MTEEEYRKLLLKHGVALELPSADVARRLMAALTAKDGANPVAAANAEVRNSAAFGHFVSGRQHALVLPPVKSVLTLVAGALTHEARHGKPKEYAKAANELLWELPRLARDREIVKSDLPFGGLMRTMAGSRRHGRLVLVDPERLEDDGDIIRASSTDFLMNKGAVRVFEHDGELYTPTGYVYSDAKTASAERVVPRNKWKGKTYTTEQITKMWDKNERDRGNCDGVLVKVRGKPYVIAESFVEFAPDHPALRFK